MGNKANAGFHVPPPVYLRDIRKQTNRHLRDIATVKKRRDSYTKKTKEEIHTVTELNTESVKKFIISNPQFLDDFIVKHISQDRVKAWLKDSVDKQEKKRKESDPDFTAELMERSFRHRRILLITRSRLLYPARYNQDELRELIERPYSDDFEAEIESHLFPYTEIPYDDINKVFILMAYKLFGKHAFPMPELCYFLSSMKANYHNIEYHNYSHAISHAQSMYWIIRKNPGVFSELEMKCLLIAAISHDVAHPGVNDGYLKATGGGLEKLYHSPILENHHTQTCFLILQDINCNVFCDFEGDDYKQITLYPSGVVGDCYNPRYYLSMGCLLSGFFCALIALADFWKIKDFHFFVVTLMLFGACQSTGWPVLLSCITHWYSGGRRGLFFGFWNTHNYIGSILGIVIAGAFADSTWGYSFCIPGFILAVVAILVYNCFVADPNDLKELDKEPATAGPVILKAREVPPWLQANRSIQFYDAMRLPGVIEFSTCMFFSRMVGYIFLFWIPTIMTNVRGMNAVKASTYAIAYCCGGSLGGILAGVFVDIYKRSVLVCAIFIVVSIPVLFALLLIDDLYVPIEVDFLIFIVIGILIEAPYVVTSTSVSAELGTHKMIKRNHRALATIGGIIEGTSAVGAAIGTFLCGFIMIRATWIYSIFMMVAMQILALLCASRQAYRDFYKKQTPRTLEDYWRSPSF